MGAVVCILFGANDAIHHVSSSTTKENLRRIIRLSDNVVNPIIRLTHDVNKFAEGNLDKRVKLDSHDEIMEIAESFNSLAQKLQDNIKNLSEISAQKKRLDAEVNVVNEILVNYLPDNFSLAEKYGFDLYAKEYPAGPFTRLVYWGTSGQKVTDHYQQDAFSLFELARYGRSALPNESR